MSLVGARVLRKEDPRLLGGRGTFVDDLATVKRTLGVPSELWSCHTTVVEGYVVEGHVPASDIRRLVEQAPTMAGIALPGWINKSPDSITAATNCW